VLKISMIMNQTEGVVDFYFLRRGCPNSLSLNWNIPLISQLWFCALFEDDGCVSLRMACVCDGVEVEISH